MKPTWVPLWLRCDSCAHEWDDWQPSYVPPSVLIAAYRALGCAKCGEKERLFMRSTPLATHPDTEPAPTEDHLPAQP